ncbi:hypothetical protein FRUB_07209 [Fimbriiglobus ruber]|uniref:Uncharacterized protein n=1 Tax=Fimbriiglobus ruber TaxID=1908690 RepID=A0A225DLL1_9BACT|nr:hypothetical protein FRUB_07209 [Fimbriiglobus ruber]
MTHEPGTAIASDLRFTAWTNAIAVSRLGEVNSYRPDLKT